MLYIGVAVKRISFIEKDCLRTLLKTGVNFFPCALFDNSFSSVSSKFSSSSFDDESRKLCASSIIIQCPENALFNFLLIRKSRSLKSSIGGIESIIRLI